VLALPVLALVLALFVWVVPRSDAQPTGSTMGAHAGAPAHRASSAQLALHDQMRRLWEDHATWTRLAIVTFADGSGGFGATAQRLLHNQEDIGTAVGAYYGSSAGEALTGLLDDHITIAVELLTAAKAHDAAGFDAAKARWYANADDIADFLSAANPRNWPQEAMRDDMRVHLDQTLAEAAAELGGDYAASVAAYEDVHGHVLMMADMLTDGIVAQFPSRFH
jgi:hypothetical protein